MWPSAIPFCGSQSTCKVRCLGCGVEEEKHLPLSSFEQVKGRAIYRVFKAKLKTPEQEQVMFCCSNVRQVSIVDDIRSGRLLIDPDTAVCVFETFDRNEARSMAPEL
jgi:hypothetical protein